MAIRHLAKNEWGSYFDHFSRPFAQGKQTEYAEIRVLSPEDGVQPETRWLPLSGITYEPRGNLLEVFVENLDHRIYHPAEIYVEQGTDGVLSSMEVVREDGIREVIELR